LGEALLIIRTLPLILRSALLRASRRMRPGRVASWFETPRYAGLLTMRGTSSSP